MVRQKNNQRSLRILKPIQIVLIGMAIFFAPTFSQAQDTLHQVPAERSHLAIIASPRADSILLRWAPGDIETWLLGNRYGYRVVRLCLMRDGKLLDNMPAVSLTDKALKPRPVSEWEQWAGDVYTSFDNKYVSIAAECIFGRDSTPTGNDPFLVARRYREEENRFGFALYAADQSLMVAWLSGLYMADRSARPNEKYLYRVFIDLPAGDTSATAPDTASVFTGIAEQQPLPPPLDFNASWGDHRVELSWDILYLRHIYTGYIVEKGTDSLTFEPLSDKASVQLTAEGVTPRRAWKSDSLADNSTTYYYRLRGVSAFGETGPPSRHVSGKGRLPISRPPTVTGNEVVDNSRVRLTWDYPAAMNGYISGFKVYRALKPDGEKKLLHTGTNPAERTFTDMQPEPTNYYLVGVYDGRTERLTPGFTYAELVDSVPPASPTGLAGTIDSTGHVYLSWARNREADIYGYRVYRANRPGFEFVLVTPALVGDTAFVDSVTVRTLDAKVYYKLRAIDRRQNHSDLSEMLELERPDLIPPVSPRIVSINTTDRGIVIEWVNSSSADVARHLVFRQTAGDTTWLPTDSLTFTPGNANTVYTDTQAAQGTTYRYRIVAEDSHGLRSDPSIPYQAGRQTPQKEGIRLKVSSTDAGVKLTWSTTVQKGIARMLIYRRIDDGALKLMDNTRGNEYRDTQVSPTKRYTYRVKAVYSDESMSPLSNEVSIEN